MKKLICILAAAAALLLTGCGQEARDARQPDAGQENQREKNAEIKEEGEEAEAEKGHCFHYKGVEISFDAEAAPVLEKLGEPKGYTEETSCAFEGLDKTYDFGSFYLQTSPKGGSDHIFCLWFADDSVATDEGIYIGSSKEEAEKAYGEESFDGTSAYVTMRGAVRLTVITADDKVSSIQYDIPLD